MVLEESVLASELVSILHRERSVRKQATTAGLVVLSASVALHISDPLVFIRLL